MPPLIPPLQSSFCCLQIKVFTIIRQLSSSRATTAAIERQKRPTRGGQNLSDRYRRLERSIRGKEVLKRLDQSLPRGLRYPSSSSRKDDAKTFRGFRIPEEPKSPGADECCMSGCAICVYDLYQDSLTTYNESIASLRSSLLALRIPESEWPFNVRTSSARVNLEHNSNVSLNAFEELERAIKEKQQERSVKDINIGR